MLLEELRNSFIYGESSSGIVKKVYDLYKNEQLEYVHSIFYPELSKPIKLPYEFYLPTRCCVQKQNFTLSTNSEGVLDYSFKIESEKLNIDKIMMYRVVSGVMVVKCKTKGMIKASVSETGLINPWMSRKMKLNGGCRIVYVPQDKACLDFRYVGVDMENPQVFNINVKAFEKCDLEVCVTRNLEFVSMKEYDQYYYESDGDDDRDGNGDKVPDEKPIPIPNNPDAPRIPSENPNFDPIGIVGPFSIISGVIGALIWSRQRRRGPGDSRLPKDPVLPVPMIGPSLPFNRRRLPSLIPLNAPNRIIGDVDNVSGNIEINFNRDLGNLPRLNLLPNNTIEEIKDNVDWKIRDVGGKLIGTVEGNAWMDKYVKEHPTWPRYGDDDEDWMSRFEKEHSQRHHLDDDDDDVGVNHMIINTPDEVTNGINNDLGIYDKYAKYDQTYKRPPAYKDNDKWIRDIFNGIKIDNQAVLDNEKNGYIKAWQKDFSPGNEWNKIVSVYDYYRINFDAKLKAPTFNDWYNRKMEGFNNNTNFGDNSDINSGGDSGFIPIGIGRNFENNLASIFGSASAAYWFMIIAALLPK